MPLPTPTDLQDYLDIFEQCDICDYPIFTDDRKIKRHEPCQTQYQKAISRYYNKLYRRLRKRDDYDPDIGVQSVITEEDRQGVHARARQDARIWVYRNPTMIAAMVEHSRRKQAQLSWERILEAAGGRDLVEETEGVPVDVLAYDYDAGRVEYGYEQWEDQFEGNGGADNTEEVAGAPKGKRNRLTNADIDRALEED